MSIRYDFKREWLKPVYLKGASVSFDMGNVFVIKDKALKGRDPEQIGFGSRSIPPQRSYSLRFNIDEKVQFIYHIAYLHIIVVQ